MYNAEQKEKFINEYTNKQSTQTACRRVFNAVEEDEIKWGADICTRTLDDIYPVLERISGMRVSSNSRIRILKAYIQWCIDKGIPDTCDALIHVKNNETMTLGSDKMKYQTVRSPKHLQAYLDAICDPVDLETPDILIRCFYWMAYGGMFLEDIVQVKTSDVIINNESKHIIKFKGEIYPIYEEAFPAFDKCLILKEFRYIHPLYGEDRIQTRNRQQSDILLRSVRTAKPTIQTMKNKLTRVAKNNANADASVSKISLSYYGAWLSGIFYRVFEAELAGAINVRELFDRLSKDFVNREYPNDDKKSKGHKVLVKRNTFIRDYKAWKETFLK